jgi:hypothetical protein
MSHALVSAATFVSVAFALVFAVAPQLHERIHASAAQPTHECAVTLIAHGNYEHGNTPQFVVVPQPAVRFATIPALKPVWVASPFLGASVFEHAPPALS